MLPYMAYMDPMGFCVWSTMTIPTIPGSGLTIPTIPVENRNALNTRIKFWFNVDMIGTMEWGCLILINVKPGLITPKLRGKLVGLPF